MTTREQVLEHLTVTGAEIKDRLEGMRLRHQGDDGQHKPVDEIPYPDRGEIITLEERVRVQRRLYRYLESDPYLKDLGRLP